MLCEQCKKREATVRFLEVVNGVTTEHNLCSVCASQLDMGSFSSVLEKEISLASLLSGLLGIQDIEKNNGKYAEVVCPNCGTTYEAFAETSRFGCRDCYSVFGPLLGDNIRHLQGSERHVGKRPDYVIKEAVEPAEEPQMPKFSTEEQIRLLQARIKDAIRREDYEEAAVIRDEIRGLKEENKA